MVGCCPVVVLAGCELPPTVVVTDAGSIAFPVAVLAGCELCAGALAVAAGDDGLDCWTQSWLTVWFHRMPSLAGADGAVAVAGVPQPPDAAVGARFPVEVDAGAKAPADAVGPWYRGEVGYPVQPARTAPTT